MENSAEANRKRVEDGTPNGQPRRPQSMEALELANEVRLERARLKAQVRNGHLGVGFLVINNPTALNNMTMSELLKAQQRWGRERVRRFLERADLHPDKKVGDLTWRQRNVVADLLEKGK